ncbi:nitrogen fixation protein FixH [Variovorax beijingensis]|uniref:Nitrogen fixation protein FixH n=1 Tax=Variovorax beijingensis TaxID=2496117 RepID=A0A3P3ELS7_9BURK|nr:FixH family protein [Variovorax beijingensis]RRH87335.1 nitrogen fixation protein FixH [Variovorax beijingensis]RSZ35625.1 nitrogen fixation protein FixH [Variovorax beijingensis]
MNTTTNELPAREDPWWRHPLLWMVIAGPALVVVASFVTFWYAWGSPDPLVSEDYYRRGVEINKTLADKKLMPAVKGRNHAATPAEAVR